MEMVNRKEQERLQKQEKQTRRSASLKVFPKMVEVVGGQYRIKDEPPLIVHYEDLGDVKKTEEYEAGKIREFFEAYLETLQDDRRVLLSRYHFVDIAQKVVGVGSVGTRTSVVLLWQVVTETIRSSCRSRKHRPLCLSLTLVPAFTQTMGACGSGATTDAVGQRHFPGLDASRLYRLRCTTVARHEVV